MSEMGPFELPISEFEQRHALELGQQLIEQLALELRDYSLTQPFSAKLTNILENIQKLSEAQRRFALNGAYNGKTALTTLMDGEVATPLEWQGDVLTTSLGKLVSQLIALGADPNQPNGEGHLPLHYAIINSKKEDVLFKILINQPGLDVTRKQDSETALGYAYIVACSLDIKKELVKRGAGRELFSPLRLDEKHSSTLFYQEYRGQEHGLSRVYMSVRAQDREHIQHYTQINPAVLSSLDEEYNFLTIMQKITPLLKDDAEVKARMEALVRDPRSYAEMAEESRLEFISPLFKPPFKLLSWLMLHELLMEKVDFLQDLAKARIEAEDILQTMMLGHRLGLKGEFSLNEGTIKEEYEGGPYPRHVLAIAERLDEFNTASADKLDATEQAVLEMARDTFYELVKAIELKDYSGQAERYCQGLPIKIPCIWDTHYAGGLLYKDKLYIANKGAYAEEPSICCYSIEPSLMHSDPGKLTAIIHELSTQKRSSNDSNVFALPAFQELKPKLLYTRPLAGQKQGNCSYTNAKRVVDTIMMALQDEAKAFVAKQKQGHVLTAEERAHLQFHKLNNQKLYKAFSDFDKMNALRECLTRFQATSNKALLDPLFCYLHDKTEHYHPRSIEMARLIIQTLKGPPLQFSDRQIVAELAKFSTMHTLNAKRYRQAALTQPGERWNYLKRALIYGIPGGRDYTRRKALIAAGINSAAFSANSWQNLKNKLNWLSKSAESQVALQTRHANEKENIPIASSRMAEVSSSIEGKKESDKEREEESRVLLYLHTRPPAADMQRPQAEAKPQPITSSVKPSSK